MFNQNISGKTTFRCARSGVHPWRLVATAAIASLFAQWAAANPITVNSLADNVFINAAGQTFSDTALTVSVSPAYCTLRMAIAAANIGTVVGGCAAGSGGDTITFSVTTPAVIELAAQAMSVAPISPEPSPPVSLLFASRQLTITGPGSGLLAISGQNTADFGQRILTVSNGNAANDLPFVMTGVTLRYGRSVGSSGGCMFSRESVTLDDVVFDGCESVGVGTNGGLGGALGVGEVNTTGNARPNVTLTNVIAKNNRSLRGTKTLISEAGAAFFGTSITWVGAVNISGSKFFGNSAERNGAFFINGATSVTITNTQVVSNSATGKASEEAGRVGGFLVFNVLGDVSLTGVSAVGNLANVERGGFSVLTVGGTVTITDSAAIGNIARTGRIGGFEVFTDKFDAVTGDCLNTQKSPVNVSGVTVRGNTAASNIGGFRIGCSGDVNMSGSTEITANEVSGISVSGSGGNSAGLITANNNVTLADVMVKDNKTLKGLVDGGYGVLTVVGNLSFTGTHLLFKDNYASENEAGLSLRPNGAGRNYSVSNSVFVGNRAKALAGLFLNATGNFSVSNTTLSGNAATDNSGALYINAHADSGINVININGVTSARNVTSPIGVGAFSLSGGPTTTSATVTVKNTILGRFQPQNGPSGFWPEQNGVVYHVSNSIIERNIAANQPSGICGVAGVICDVDAKLEGLADNGGNTYTHALRPGSPALDTGDGTGAPAFDQRGTGFTRVFGSAIDIGAFESPMLATVPPCKLDMNNDGFVRANQEGLVLLRSMLGFSGGAVIAGTGISQFDWDAARNNLNTNCGTSLTP